jgi:hypothetical protein
LKLKPDSQWSCGIVPFFLGFAGRYPRVSGIGITAHWSG